MKLRSLPGVNVFSSCSARRTDRAPMLPLGLETDEMNAAIERRTTGRHPCDCEASWSYFNKDGAATARILNFSPRGSYIETDHPLTPGATVLIRVLQCVPAKGYPEGLPVNGVAEVKWCREVDPSSARHGAGVRYHFPV